MNRQPKVPKAPGLSRFLVGENVKRLLEHKYAHLPNITQQQKAFAKDSGLPSSTIQRICKAEVGGNLETLEAVATGFGLAVYQLLIPSIDAGNPQVVPGATKEEQRLYRLFEQAKRARQGKAQTEVS